MPVIPALWEAETSGWPEIRSLRPAWPTRRTPVSTKNTKIGQVWWCKPVVPATWEAKTGELLGRQRLQWDEITPLYSILGDRARLCLKKWIYKNKKYKRGYCCQWKKCRQCFAWLDQNLIFFLEKYLEAKNFISRKIDIDTETHTHQKYHTAL